MIYGTGNLFNESTLVDINLDEIQESAYEPGIQGAMMHVLESEENYKNVMEAVAFQELAYFAENGTELIYEASTMGGFFTKVKEIFKKIIEKVAGLFKKFMALINSYVKSDSDFVKKYRNELLKVSTKDFEFRGYKFTIGKISVKGCENSVQSLIASKMKSFGGSLPVQYMKDTVKSVREDRTDIVELMRGVCIPGQKSIEAGEFSKELFQVLRDGEESPVTIDKVNVSDLLSTITNAKDAKKGAEDAYKEVKKAVEDSIKQLEKLEKEYTKQVPDKDKDDTKTQFAAASVSYISTFVSLLKDKASILQVVNGAILSALRQENRQAKAVCVKLLTYKPKNESGIHESAPVGSFLDSVVLK